MRSYLSALPSAVLLATTGGFLDAIVYLTHGHVFANAMTGNVIFLGIALVEQNWAQAVRHLFPIAAFVLGVLAARALVSFPQRHGALLSLSFEIVALFLVGLLPRSFPEAVFTGTISFASAFQVTTFRRVGRFTYNSTFVTGNLREVGEGAFDRIFSPDPAARLLGGRKFVKLSFICIGFLSGAILGAVLAHRQTGHAVWFAEPLLLAVLGLTLIRPHDATTR